MSYLVIDDVSTYVPPENTALIYSITANESVSYKYKYFASGAEEATVGDVPANVLPLLAVELTDIPCLVFIDDLTAALAKTIASTSNLTVALSSKGAMAYVAEVAKRKVDKTDFLSAYSKIGESLDTVASDLSSEAGTRADADSALSGRLDTVEATLPTKVDKVTNSSLVPDSEITKLAAYPSYSDVESAIGEKQTATQVNTAIATALEDYSTTTQMNSAISAAVASAFKYMGVVDNVALLPAVDAEGLAVGHVYHVNNEYRLTNDAKFVDGITYYTVSEGVYTAAEVTVGEDIPANTYYVSRTLGAEYAFNGTSWEELGSIIDLSAYSTTAQMTAAIDTAEQSAKDYADGLSSNLDSRVDVLEAATAGYDGTDTVAAAIAAAEQSAKDYADGLDSTMDGRVDVLEAAAAGYDGTSTIAAAISAAQSAAEATASADATSKANAAEAAAKSYADGLDTAMDGRMDVVEAATAGYDGTSTISAAISAAQSAAEATAAADATSKADAAEAAAKQYADGLDSAMDGRVDVLEAAAAGFDGNSTIAAAIAAKADPVEVVILGTGTASAPQAVNLVPGKWYVAKAPFTGTLPASAAEGTYIKVSIAVGGDLRRVAPASGETINGSTNQCALGITGEGIAINAETYYFMKVGTDWVIL